MNPTALLPTSVLSVLLAVAAPSWSAEPAAAKPADAKPADAKPADAKPADADATAEQQAEIDALIKQLGDDSFDVREAATEKLIKLGRVALPALQRATKHTDVEVRTRAARAIETIAPAEVAKRPAPREEGFPVVPVVPGGGLILPGGGARIQIQVGGIAVNGAGQKDIRIQEDGRSVRIREDDDGILVELTETDAAGKTTTKEFKAKTVEELKKNHPEGHELYQKYGGGAAAFQVVPGRVGGVGGRVAPRVRVPARNAAAEAAARKQLEEVLKQLGPQGEDILKELRRIEELQRKILGEALGEENKARLGVMVDVADETLRSQLGFAGGVVVRRVVPGSRAEKLGLREHDILLKLNGEAIADSAGLVALLEKLGDAKLSLEGLRAGKPLSAAE